MADANAVDGVLLAYPVGTVLRGKYRLDSVLGVGGMAIVYAATHRNQKRFAVKMLHKELSSRQDIRERFLREGYAANTVEHPGAVAVLDDDVTEDGTAFLVMELLEGESVEHLWERSNLKLPVADVLAIADQLTNVLAAAHAKSVVHRDIKPANLFITREGQLKVLDFGIARVRDVAATVANATSTGVLLGTPAFMSPEQALAKSNDIDASTDVWAAGATMFALLTGRNVHEGDNGQQVLIRAATAHAPSLAMVEPSTPKAVAEIVDRALAFDKNQRWSSAVAMRDAIRDVRALVVGKTFPSESQSSLAGDVGPWAGRDPWVAPVDWGPVGTPHFDKFAGRPQSDPARVVCTNRTNTWESPREDQSGVPMENQSPFNQSATAGSPPIQRAPPITTTSRPVSRFPVDASHSRNPGRNVRMIAVVSVVLVFVGALVLGIRMMTGSRATNGDSGSLAARPSQSVEPPVQATANSVSPAIVTLASVAPLAASAPPPPLAQPKASPPVAPRTPAAAGPAPQSARPQCNPPYTWDPSTKVKHWKAECL